MIVLQTYLNYVFAVFDSKHSVVAVVLSVILVIWLFQLSSFVFITVDFVINSAG